MATMVVEALVAACVAFWLGALIGYQALLRALQRHGLPAPGKGDWRWMRAAYPPDVHRIRVLYILLVAGVVVCLSTAAAISEWFELCRGEC
jgi:hypothetical protein